MTQIQYGPHGSKIAGQQLYPMNELDPGRNYPMAQGIYPMTQGVAAGPHDGPMVPGARSIAQGIYPQGQAQFGVEPHYPIAGSTTIKGRYAVVPTIASGYDHSVGLTTGPMVPGARAYASGSTLGGYANRAMAGGFPGEAPGQWPCSKGLIWDPTKRRCVSIKASLPGKKAKKKAASIASGRRGRKAKKIAGARNAYEERAYAAGCRSCGGW